MLSPIIYIQVTHHFPAVEDLSNTPPIPTLASRTSDSSPAWASCQQSPEGPSLSTAEIVLHSPLIPVFLPVKPVSGCPMTVSQSESNAVCRLLYLLSSSLLPVPHEHTYLQCLDVSGPLHTLFLPLEPLPLTPPLFPSSPPSSKQQTTHGLTHTAFPRPLLQAASFFPRTPGGPLRTVPRFSVYVLH